ncbi:GrpB family protein [Paenibacillus thailandensis]|uniref:GrpB family protein n=1 Tax=Paenibacillus thailandensis TaxID=393250 RepID=A0ABW5R464_9BACL
MRIVEVIPYNKQWVQQFQEEANRLRQILGPELVEIHHIGSTSVSGLAAKPIIDVMPIVQNIHLIDQYKECMISNGYEPKGENGIPGRRYFVKGGHNRSHHIHIYDAGNPQIQRHLAFRDYLRAHPDAAREYGELKTKLASQFPHDITAYIKGKAKFVEKIDKRATDWYASNETAKP